MASNDGLPSLRALWSLLDGILDILKDRRGEGCYSHGLRSTKYRLLSQASQVKTIRAHSLAVFLALLGAHAASPYLEVNGT